MDPAGEDQAHDPAAAIPRSMASPTTRDGLFPENEAGPRADMPAAFTALEHEPARPVAQILVEQAGRGDMQIGSDSLSLQAGCLVGAAAGDQVQKGAEFADDGELLGTELRRHKAQDAHAPRPSRELPGRFPQERSDFRLAKQRQGQKR